MICQRPYILACQPLPTHPSLRGPSQGSTTVNSCEGEGIGTAHEPTIPQALNLEPNSKYKYKYKNKHSEWALRRAREKPNHSALRENKGPGPGFFGYMWRLPLGVVQVWPQETSWEALQTGHCEQTDLRTTVETKPGSGTSSVPPIPP